MAMRLIGLALLLSPLWAQAPIQSLAQGRGVVVSGEYSPRQYPLRFTNGQVVTITIAGLGEDIETRVRATSNPLPKELAGVSAFLYQAQTRFEAPILQVDPFWTCPIQFATPLARGEKCGTQLAVTLQIPVEFQVSPPFPVARSAPNAQLVIYYKGVAGAAVDIAQVPDSVHLLTLCDFAVRGQFRPETFTGPCGSPIVRHADGTAANPVRPGDKLTLFAYGLSPVPGGPPSGHVATEPIAIQGYRLHYEYGRHAKMPDRNRDSLQPDFIGMAAGSVGLYQINFTVPPAPEGLPSCPSESVSWNLAVSLTGPFSTDGVQLCVQLPE